MINFHRVCPEDRDAYEKILSVSSPRGCEYAFANMCFWGRQEIAFLHGCIAIFAHFEGRSVYGYPIGPGDRRAVIRDMLQDAKERGIPCRIGSLTAADREELEQWYPDDFLLVPDRDGQDYVYDINDLADLKGRKFQRKRNHVNRFRAAHENYAVEPITKENMEEAKKLVCLWYRTRMESREGDYLLEQVALDRTFRYYEALDLQGLLLKIDGDTVAMTIGSFLTPDTIDVHFEKAREDIDGAYAAINSEFARYLREKYPQVKYLNREDDMGLEGLRKAKTSYNPHHMVEKHRAYPKEDIDDT